MMKVKFAYEFDAGIIDIPGEKKISGRGVLPLISHLTDPREHKFDEAELNKMVEEIHDWMRSLGLSNESFVTLATDFIRANIVGWWVPCVAELGHSFSVMYCKFLLIFWILDDFMEHYFDNPNAQQDDTSKLCELLYSLMESIWKDPEAIQSSELESFSCWSLVQILIAAWKSLILDLKTYIPLYLHYQSVMDAVKSYLSGYSWADNKNCKQPSSEFTYRAVRRNFTFLDGLWEFEALLCGVSLSARVREHRYFSPMLAAFGDIVSFENDVMSLQKEAVEGESCNLLLVKVKQGASALEAMNETLRCIWDTYFEAIKLADLLLEAFPDELQLSSYIKMGEDFLNGTAVVHCNMQRYILFSGRIISLPEFKFPEEQAEFVFKCLLKTKKAELLM